MKIEFQNSIRKLSFWCHHLDIKIAWINPCNANPIIKLLFQTKIDNLLCGILFHRNSQIVAWRSRIQDSRFKKNSMKMLFSKNIKLILEIQNYMCPQ